MEDENKVFKEIIEWSICILIALILALLTRFYIGAPTIVKQKSMNPTLQENQRLWVNRVKRITGGEYLVGDIVTFEAPTYSTQIDLSNPVAKYDYAPEKLTEKLVYYVLELNKTSYIKRVIGVEGDLIQIKDGKVYRNGEVLKEEYLPEETTTKAEYYNNVIVPENCVYVMGDNRDESMDSRTFGCIPLDKIEGKVIFRYWPLSEISGI